MSGSFTVISTMKFSICRYSGEGVPSFHENRDSMMEDLEKSGWPLSKDEIERYEKEIRQAEIYLSQSKELQETAEKVVMSFYWEVSNSTF